MAGGPHSHGLRLDACKLLIGCVLFSPLPSLSKPGSLPGLTGFGLSPQIGGCLLLGLENLLFAADRPSQASSTFITASPLQAVSTCRGRAAADSDFLASGLLTAVELTVRTCICPLAPDKDSESLRAWAGSCQSRGPSFPSGLHWSLPTAHVLKLPMLPHSFG